MATGTERKRYTLYLINPRRKYRFHWDLKEVCAIMNRKTAIHPLALPTVAALTPDNYDVRILDEEMEAIDPDRRPLPDIVGITAVVPNVKRGYELADQYRARGVPVVMGGAQVSFNVEETLRHADTVVVGEAEGAWEQCLRDFENGTLRTTYKREAPCEFKHPPAPRWDLVDTKKVMALGVQVSRGCPHNCDFCLVRNMFGRRQRYRDVDNVIEEIRGLPKKQISFIDDNLTGNRKYVRELMRKLKPLKVWWMCQASIQVAYDQELLREMADAGCISILFGFESINPASLREMNKPQNEVERYEEAVRRVHAMGINVVGSFIVGFDADTVEAFDEIYDFTVRNNISYIMLNVLTAYPGTDLYERMKATGRLNYHDPDLLNGVYPTMRSMNMSQTQMYNRYFETLEKMFDYGLVRRKAVPVLGNGAFHRFNAGEVGFRDKFISSFQLIRMYLFSSDRAKRRLFLSLVRFGLTNRASMGVIVEFLLFVSSFHGYLDYTKEHREEILGKIAAADLGPWRDDPRSREQTTARPVVPSLYHIGATR
jgi:radical SAM superfamily enzyme YgiQ (UPF0313 family)